MSWLNKLLNGKNLEIKETPQTIKKSAWLDGALSDDSIKKEASIEDERLKHIKNLSTDGLSHIYTEIRMQKDGKKIPELYMDEYYKNREKVLKDRVKIEEELLSLIPAHSQEEKFKKWAAKSPAIIDVNSIWMVKNIDGEEVIIRAMPDMIDSIKTTSQLFTKNMLVKNISCSYVEKDVIGKIT